MTTEVERQHAIEWLLRAQHSGTAEQRLHAPVIIAMLTEDDPCVCGETSSRNCPVHANESEG